MKKQFAIAALLAVCGLVGVAHAQDDGGEAAAKPAKKDKAAEKFAAMDKDGNGSLTLEEFVGDATEKKAEKAAADFAIKDTDQDGKLTMEEFKAKPMQEKEKKEKKEGDGEMKEKKEKKHDHKDGEKKKGDHAGHDHGDGDMEEVGGEM